MSATAAPAKPTEQEVAAVANQLASLQRQVRTLQRQVRTLRTRVTRAENVAFTAFGFGVCLGALTTDALRGTWAVIDQISQQTLAGRTYFGSQPIIDDAGVCAEARIQRSQAVPPTMAPFQALYALLRFNAQYALPSR